MRVAGLPPLIGGQPNVRSIVDYYIKLNSATVVQTVVKLWIYLHPFAPKENESEIWLWFYFSISLAVNRSLHLTFADREQSYQLGFSQTRRNGQQVCIPAGFVPPACCPYLPACTAQGGSAPGGGSVPGKGCLLSQHALRQSPPPLWTEWLTDRCKNITFPNFVCGR